MLCRRPKPVIGKLSELFVSGNLSSASREKVTCPRTPLDLKNMQSPIRFKSSYELVGVGLGIVVTLDKEHGPETILPQYSLCNSNLNRSHPIPIHPSDGFDRGFHGMDDMRAPGSLENYTYVTYHVPSNKTLTKVYYDGSEVESRRHGAYHSNEVCDPTKSSAISIQVEKTFPNSDFLSSCHLCGKDLHGKDIYMYRGEKAFCSTECRARQIMMDERKEQCRSEASRSVEVASSPARTRDQIFSTGVLVI